MLAVALELDDAPPVEEVSAKSDGALTTLDGLNAVDTGWHEPASLEMPVEE